MTTGWACRRLQAALVDVAEGAADADTAARVAAHVAACAACAADLAALRTVPDRLRAAAPTRPDAAWAAQREAIAARLGATPPVPRRHPGARRVAGSLVALAAAAGLVLALRTPAPVVAPDGLETLDAAALLAVDDATDAIVPDGAWVSDAAWLAEPPPAHELTPAELERIRDLVGAG